MNNNYPYPNAPIPWFSNPHDYSGDNNLGIYATETTQRYTLGTRALDWDGSVYRYGLASAAISNTEQAVHTASTGAGVSYETIAVAASAGDRTLTVDQASITKDQYAGGYVVIFNSGASGNIRGVVSNTVSSSAGLVTLTLDYPIAAALTTSDAYELYASPYSSLSQANTSGTLSFLGMPTVTAASGAYFWTKTWGPIFINPQSGIGAAYVRTAYFRHDGSIDVRDNIGTNVTDQIAGHILVGSASGDGPLLMLTVCP